MTAVAPTIQGETKNPIGALLAEGQSTWQNDLPRQMLPACYPERRIAEVGSRGLASNPTVRNPASRDTRRNAS